jgi:monovalent cation:H+ antiporter-2, CPA2 family
MFGVGLHFHLKDLMRVKSVAIPGAVGQSAIATLLAMAVFHAFGMPLQTGVVLGMAMAVASTVVLMRVLMDADVLSSPQGHVAVGWLIVEDIFTVILLVLIPVLATTGAEAAAATDTPVWQTLGIALVKLCVLVAIVLLAGARIVPWVLVRVARLRSRELFTLTVLVFSIAIATASYYYFGASMALGAFLAGMVVAQSPVSHQAAADALPMRDAFAVLFFVSVGMLFDPVFLIEQPLMILAALGIIMLAKPLAALIIVAVLGHSVRTALTVAIGLAQIGEFSFILSDLARRHGLMPDAGHNVLVAAAIISITLNPLLFRSLPKVELWLRARPRLWRLLNARAERKAAILNLPDAGAPVSDAKQLAVVVGYGPVGRSVHRALQDAGLSTVIIDMNMDTVSALHAEGHHAIYGDATNQGILEQAGVPRASHVIVTMPDASHRAAVVTASRNLSETARIIVRARYLREREELERGGATAAVFEEAEAAVALAHMVLADTGSQRQSTDRKIQDIRRQFIMDNLSHVRSQPVTSVMVPWARVGWLSSAADRQSVLARIARERFSHWPVIDHQSRRPIGRLAAVDLISGPDGDGWLHLVRPLGTVRPDDSVTSTLTRMQDEETGIYLVEEEGAILGLVTMDDILEQVVKRLDDERSSDPVDSLSGAVSRGGILPSLTATTRDHAIRELVEAVPANRLPPGTTIAQLMDLALEREKEISTDLGNGVALPHARCPELEAPLVVIGRSTQGVLYSTAEAEPVHLLFLLVTPAEHPELQLALLRQVARLVRKESTRRELNGAASPAELLEIIHRLARDGEVT